MSAEETMGDNEEMAGEYDTLITEGRKNNFCMIFLKVFAVALLVGAVCASLFSKYDIWKPFDPKGAVSICY